MGMFRRLPHALAIVVGLVLVAATGALGNSIGNALNLSEFEIQMAPESGSTAQLTVGQQIGQNLFVKVEQGLGEASSTDFILEYELANWLRVLTRVLQGSTIQPSVFQRVQGNGADLIFLCSY
jgi:autotransporter translocation and assembly factor TamB